VAAWAIAVMGVAPALCLAQPDALLSPWPEQAGPLSATSTWRVEAGFSGVNRHIDFSDPEDDPALAAQNARGNYRAAQLAVGWAPMDQAWLSGRLTQRWLSDGVDRFRYLGWQLAGQWRWHPLSAGAGSPTLAVRVGAWGHHADQTVSSTPVRVPGAILDTVNIAGPGDRTVQIDAVAGWRLRPNLALSLLASLGETRLFYDALTATTTRNGCRYRLQFNGNDIYGELAQACDAPTVIEQFFDSSGSYGVDVASEIAWHGRFMQLGLNLRGESGTWTWAAGWLWHRVRRSGVDEIVRERGRTAYADNRVLALDAAWRFQPQWAWFARAELGSKLFFNELPVSYNSSTAGRFGGRLSLLSTGLRASF
jgi:hypothetical protein